MSLLINLYKRIPLHPWWAGPLGFMGLGIWLKTPAFLGLGFTMLLMMGSVFPWVKLRGLGRGFQLLGLQSFFIILGWQQYALAQIQTTDDICRAFNFVAGIGDLAIDLLGWLTINNLSIAGLLCGIGGLIVITILIGGVYLAGRATLGSANHGFNMTEMSQPIISLVYFIATLAIMAALLAGLASIS